MSVRLSTGGKDISVLLEVWRIFLEYPLVLRSTGGKKKVDSGVRSWTLGL
jgi:hypothetical protein